MHSRFAALPFSQIAIVEAATVLSPASVWPTPATSLASNMNYGSVLDVVNAVDSERAAIWQRHPDWSEEQRQLFYEHRKAQIASSFGVSPMEPRGLNREPERTLALDQDVDQGRTVGTFAHLYLVWTNTPRRLDIWTSALRSGLTPTPQRSPCLATHPARTPLATTRHRPRCILNRPATNDLTTAPTWLTRHPTPTARQRNERSAARMDDFDNLDSPP